MNRVAEMSKDYEARIEDIKERKEAAEEELKRALLLVEKAEAERKAREARMAEEKSIWEEARVNLETELSNSRVELNSIKEELSETQKSLCDVQGKLLEVEKQHDLDLNEVKSEWEEKMEEALIQLRQDQEQERERLIEMLSAKAAKAVSSDEPVPAKAMVLDSGPEVVAHVSSAAQ